MNNEEYEKLQEEIARQEETNNQFYYKLIALDKADSLGIIKRPIGFWNKKCPLCKEKIKKQYTGGYIYYSCVCGYECAIENSFY